MQFPNSIMQFLNSIMQFSGFYMVDLHLLIVFVCMQVLVERPPALRTD